MLTKTTTTVISTENSQKFQCSQCKEYFDADSFKKDFMLCINDYLKLKNQELDHVNTTHSE